MSEGEYRALRAVVWRRGHGVFGALGDSAVTGPTNTNVNDFPAVLIAAP